MEIDTWSMESVLSESSERWEHIIEKAFMAFIRRKT